MELIKECCKDNKEEQSGNKSDLEPAKIEECYCS